MTRSINEHPAPEELERFIRGELPQHQSVAVVAHLLRYCPSCQAHLQPFIPLIFGDESLESGQPKNRRSKRRHRREVSSGSAHRYLERAR
jgi:hypothetical protein